MIYFKAAICTIALIVCIIVYGAMIFAAHGIWLVILGVTPTTVWMFYGFVLILKSRR